MRLNIREFSDLLAKAANDKQISEEKATYDEDARKVTKLTKNRKSKWEVPGGPI